MSNEATTTTERAAPTPQYRKDGLKIMCNDAAVYVCDSPDEAATVLALLRIGWADGFIAGLNRASGLAGSHK